MGSSSKRQQTMAKRTREQIVKERRAEKLEKRLEKRQAAARGENPVDSPFSTPTVDADGSVSELPSDPSGGYSGCRSNGSHSTWAPNRRPSQSTRSRPT